MDDLAWRPEDGGTVYFNGSPVQHPIAADEDLGVVVCWATRKSDGGRIKKRFYGYVEIVRPDPLLGSLIDPEENGENWEDYGFSEV